MKLRNKLIDILITILNKLIQEPVLPVITKEAELGLFAQIYENPTFRKFCDAREDYLTKMGMEKVIDGTLTKTEIISGQIIEIRNLRARARSAYIIIEKIRKEKLSTEEKEKKT
jgi:hypothetical protein